jgi:hypothetical protein
MADKNFTREAIVAWIKAKLGYPVVELELTDEQLDICIDDALDEISPWVVQRQYVTLPVSECIDLTEYNVSYVINVHKANGANESNVDAIDVFSPYTYMEVRGTFQGITYNRVESQLYQNLLQSTKDNISYRFIKPKLYLDIGIPKATMVTIEYSPNIDDLDSLTDPMYKKFVKRFSLAFARAMLSDIRGKFSVSGSPVELDGSTQDTKSERELDQLRQELKDTVTTHFMVD